MQVSFRTPSLIFAVCEVEGRYLSLDLVHDAVPSCPFWQIPILSNQKPKSFSGAKEAQTPGHIILLEERGRHLLSLPPFLLFPSSLPPSFPSIYGGLMGFDTVDIILNEG
jgi:hypothetical protein